ncbi:hypothetical protein Lalb_Chr25g0289771 [Lupinus albus]|uniref:Uncharacterized protein n=1 Tax=Lupinus albus TaxID=3870 RepID=A0A6A4MNN9_LUPAL|nr:hypothetical protein Lalb_Chr25g0289771 [Lupinus albus]
MDSKEEGEPHKDNPLSMSMLHHLSEEAFRASGEALQNMYYGGGGDSSGGSSVPQVESGVHRRSQSEIVAKGFHQSNGFQKLKSHVKGWRWSGSKYREEASFNPEIMANQKRQWYQLHPKSLDRVDYKKPTSLFEHFVIVGLHPDVNLEAVEFARSKKWEKEKENSEHVDYRMLQRQRLLETTSEPQVCYMSNFLIDIFDRK